MNQTETWNFTHVQFWAANLLRDREPVKQFEIDDIMLPDLDLPSPCKICIEITNEDVILTIANRDWQWERATGELVGMGMTFSLKD